MLGGPREDQTLCGLEAANHWYMHVPLEEVTLVFL